MMGAQLERTSHVPCAMCHVSCSVHAAYVAYDVCIVFVVFIVYVMCVVCVCALCTDCVCPLPFTGPSAAAAFIAPMMLS